MKTTGLKYLAAAALVSASFYIFWTKNKKTVEKFNLFSNLENYKPYNSFIEHFDSSSIEEAYSKYKKYLEFGLNQENAFKSVIENKIRKND